MSRIYLSPPEVQSGDLARVVAAMESNWVAPVGPELEAFEREVANVTQRKHGVALTSGTAAIHLGLKELGVGPGDEVLMSTLTFVASANAALYLGARPVFIDSDIDSWNMSPSLVATELADRSKAGSLPRAAVVVDLYGQCADFDRLLPVFAEYGIPVLEDAAEALGATYRDRHAGSFGEVGIVSFNGNKVITTSGGGMLVCDNQRLAERVRFLATQAREPAPHYEHKEIGYNYRLSNVLAALGRSQLSDLDRRVTRRREINARYRSALEGTPGVDFMPEVAYGRSSCWLTCITVDEESSGHTRDDVRDWLEREDIEARPVWKPMHRQPLFAGAASRVDGTSDWIFERGLCLPSGSGLSDADQDRIVSVVLEALRQ